LEPVNVLFNLVLVRDSVNLTLFGDEHRAVAVAYAGLDARRVRPHPLAARRATLIDDVSRNAAARCRSSGCACCRSPASSPPSPARRRFQESQCFELVDPRQTVQRATNLVPIAL